MHVHFYKDGPDSTHQYFGKVTDVRFDGGAPSVAIQAEGFQVVITVDGRADADGLFRALERAVFIAEADREIIAEYLEKESRNE